jgi:hypothetical protein
MLALRRLLERGRQYRQTGNFPPKERSLIASIIQAGDGYEDRYSHWIVRKRLHGSATHYPRPLHPHATSAAK